MKHLKSYSQAGQDIFVRRVLGTTPGTFLDIGCAGDQWSNTKALEEDGWTGWLVDTDPNAAKGRGNFICADATKMKWSEGFFPPKIDYLSLDVDENSLDALKNLPLDATRFRVITIEHDAYRFGDKLRDGERAILTAHGYQLVCKDVCGAPNAPFEDWWVDPRNVHDHKYTKFTSVGKMYTDILHPPEPDVLLL